MKDSSINIDQLRRNKTSSAESKLEWLWSAVVFAKAKKTVKKTLKKRVVAVRA